MHAIPQPASTLRPDGAELAARHRKKWAINRALTSGAGAGVWAGPLGRAALVTALFAEHHPRATVSRHHGQKASPVDEKT